MKKKSGEFLCVLNHTKACSKNHLAQFYVDVCQADDLLWTLNCVKNIENFLPILSFILRAS